MRRRRPARRPAPTDFWESPHLSTLDVLDYTLDVFTVALAAEHPGVFDIGRQPALPPDRLARKIAAAADKLHRLLVAYRDVVEPPPAPLSRGDDELF
jgi:hypothetical protein